MDHGCDLFPHKNASRQVSQVHVGFVLFILMKHGCIILTFSQ